MRLDDLLDDVETEAEPLAAARLPVADVKRIEDVRQYLGRYAAAVSDRQHYRVGMGAVEQVLDHPAHALAARQHALGGRLHGIVVGNALQQVGRGDDGVQRVAQIMAEYGDEHLVEAQSLGALAQLLREPLLLTIEFKKNLGLTDENVRFDRFVEDIHRAGFVAFEHATLIALAGGDKNERHMAAAIAAAHQFGVFEAIHVGHQHIEERERDVMDQQQLQRFGAGTRLEQFHIVAPQQRRERKQILLEVINQQALQRWLHEWITFFI